jgi:hypothetical protein
MSNRILLYGNEPSLAETRVLVFKFAGYDVSNCSPTTKLSTIPEHPPVQLAVIDHSLNQQEQKAAAVSIHKRWPDARLLYLDQHVRTLEQMSDREYRSVSMNPDQLIQDCRRVLNGAL